MPTSSDVSCWAYSHMLLSERNIPEHLTFRRAFEDQCGMKLLELVASTHLTQQLHTVRRYRTKKQPEASLDQIHNNSVRQGIRGNNRSQFH
jgi:hypothetical protein